LLALFFALFRLQKSSSFGGVAMAQFNAESPIADWLKHNVSFWACFLFPFFLCPSFAAPKQCELIFSCQGWSLVMPEGVTRVGHLLLLSEEEFLASLMDPARHSVGRICYRAAVKVCAPVVPAAGPGSAPAAGVSLNNAPTQTQTFTPTFTPNINIIMPPSGGAVPVSHAKAVPKSSREEERPADSQKKQTNIAALFGKAPPSFTGLSDEKVLQAVKWAPIESGGHTAGSKVSVFRNKFMADFVRQNPSLVFDKGTERDVRARSLTAYEARGTEVVVESGDAASGLWYVGPEKDPEQLDGTAQVEQENEADGMRENESARSAKTRKSKKQEREVVVEEDRIRKSAKLAQEPISAEASSQNPEEAMTEGDQKPQEAEVKKGQGEKRPLADDDVGSGSSEIDLVQEAVNPDGKSFTVTHLKVTFVFCCFSSQLFRHGCANTVFPLEAISPNWLIEWRVL